MVRAIILKCGIGAVFLMGSVGLALAQGAEVPFGGLSHDNSLPVEITADSLSINQAASTAAFEGNVLVGQGSLKISADKIEVRYASLNGNPTGAVSEIRAVGSVVLTNGTEAAEAGRATYDVASGSILMEGDVLLTQGSNALSGQKLRIDLTTGIARMEGRVQTIFQPGTNP